jgi:hypothetical protein
MPNSNRIAQSNEHQGTKKYPGPFIIKQLEDGTYTWAADNKKFYIADYNDIQTSEIINRYYREGLEDAVTNNNYSLIPWAPVTPAQSDEFRIYDYVPAHLVPAGDRSTVPYDINYKGVDLIQRLHKRVWKQHGLVVQVIYFAEYDVQTDTHKHPVVIERWLWTLDPSTNFAIKRDIEIQWYKSTPTIVVVPDDPDTEEDEGEYRYEHIILGPKKVFTKYYTTTAEKIFEIQRRRDNVIHKLSEDVMGMIAYTETAGDIPAAITLGQAYMTEVATEIANFKEHGVDDLAVVTETQTPVRDNHPWLDNDLAPVGFPGVLMYQFIAAEVRLDISDSMDAFDYGTLPTYEYLEPGPTPTPAP